MSDLNLKIKELREKIERGEFTEADTLALNDLGLTYETLIQAAGEEGPSNPPVDLFKNRDCGFRNKIPAPTFIDRWNDKPADPK
ncbi:MAG: hypothetical protein H7Y13_01120 [Sphingobacteriaceae bacterium]|nr:hypothetical protein [Sphingobacteriaceae bacterium]